MGLTTRPKRNIDLTKIDEIQDEFFDKDEPADKTKDKDNKSEVKPSERKPSAKAEATLKSKAKSILSEKSDKKTDDDKLPRHQIVASAAAEQGNLKIADLLATAKTGGVRYTSRPFTIPRSLTIDLNRMKAQFKTRDLHYTQNELMDKMIKESLETVTAENYFDLREKAFRFVKSPEQSSRRTVTLTEEAATGMAELKADLSLRQNRRVSSDEIFTTLLVIAFSGLYENGLL